MKKIKIKIKYSRGQALTAGNAKVFLDVSVYLTKEVQMEDRFNFRVFDKRYNTLKDVDSFSFNEKMDRVAIWYKDGSMEKFIDVNDVVFMQCTGLKDKKGTLIYEGDILIVQEDCSKEDYYTAPKKMVVAWEKAKAYLGLRDFDKPQNGAHDFYRYGYFYEVIGNIYENPELLEGG